METVSVSGFFTSAPFLLTAIVFAFYLCLKYTVYNFWSRKGVPHEPPSIPLGNIPISYFTGKTIHGSILKETYMKFKHFRFHGFYMLCEPVLVINDPELIQCVLVKNFNHFCNRGVFNDEHKDSLSTTLARMNDDKWKNLRGKLSPSFTPNKLKLMYPLIDEVCQELVKTVDKALEANEIMECNELITRYTTDCISSAIFGFNCNSLQDSNAPFLKHGRLSNYIGRVFLLFSFFIPHLAKYVPVPTNRQMNEKFFADIFVNMVESRRREKSSRNDILNSLIRLMDDDQVAEDDKFTMNEAVAQSFVFFAASQATVVLTTVYCLYELALNPDIQEKLFLEIHETHSSSDGLTHEKLFGMKYLDMVYQETLRKHPASSILHRICTKDFNIPDSNFTIEKGTRIIIPLSGLHMDPDIYPEPEKFDPSRFEPENKAKRHNSTYSPFGEGPRQCIAKRLGILKSKMALSYLLLNYKFSACDRTPASMKYLPDNFFQIPADVHLKLEKREITKT